MKQIKIFLGITLVSAGLCFAPILLAETTEDPNRVLEAAENTTEQPAAEVLSARDQREAIKDSVVHVSVVKHAYSTLTPWNSNTRKGSGSGFIVEGGQVLTNAHVVSDATFIELQRHGETRRHEAEILFISHEADLALLRPIDPEVFANITPLELGKLPQTQQDIEVFGFPIGGNTLSVTRGVVSRIEKQNYAHTNQNLLAVQVDAAINFGNSGGPGISDGKVVGVAMQSGFFTENIGYLIPTPVIRHFLTDIEDGQLDGFGFPGFLVQSMENDAVRRKYELDDETTGILIHRIYKDSPAEAVLELGDIITHVDGHNIQNNGTVEFRPGEFIDYTHYIDMHQLHDEVTFNIIRDAEPLEIAISLDKTAKDYLLVRPSRENRQPTYFIYGGFVFMPLTENLLDILNNYPPISALAYEAPSAERQEVAIMTRVLPADINKDYHREGGLLITKVNGESYVDFAEFYQKVTQSEGTFLTLQADDGFNIVIEHEEAEKRQPDILARYGINRALSSDLEALSADSMVADNAPTDTDTDTDDLPAQTASEPLKDAKHSDQAQDEYGQATGG